MNGPDHRHAATCRCLTEDLGFPEADCDRPIAELTSNKVVADFIAKRTDSPTGQEVIQSLAPRLIAYSLHSGRHRAATWFHEDLGVVWLLASRLHREGSKDDAYPYFARLLSAGRLLPTREDIARVVRSRSRTFAQALVEDVPQLRESVLSQPGKIHEEVLGGRVRLRLLYEPGDPSLLTVAVSQRLEPGAMALPPEWQVQLLAAMFPQIRLEEISIVDSLGDESLRPDEVGYCAVV